MTSKPTEGSPSSATQGGGRAHVARQSRRLTQQVDSHVVSDATLFHYEGPLDGAYELVDELQAAGFAVEWAPPSEERTSAVEAVAIAIVARGAYDALLSVVGRVRDRLASNATIEMDTDEASPQGQPEQTKPHQ